MEKNIRDDYCHNIFDLIWFDPQPKGENRVFEIERPESTPPALSVSSELQYLIVYLNLSYQRIAFF